MEYREAITDIYNRLLVEVKSAGIKIHAQATPRELERNLVTRGTRIDEKLLDDLISVFEEAHYSLHPIARKDFLKAKYAFEGLKFKALDSDLQGDSKELDIELIVHGNDQAPTTSDQSDVIDNE